MELWRKKPFVYQINTCVWLNTLSQQHGHPVTLATVPDAALDALAALNVDAVWLMGLWQRSPAARASALNYIHEYRPVLPDLTEDDVLGSAYAIGSYRVDPAIGGRAGLAALRTRLRSRGLLLMTDFVPNHTATDHEWVSDHPDYYVQGTARQQRRHSDIFFPSCDAWGRSTSIAHGRDPYFPPWIDTAQLNAWSAGYRAAAVATLRDLADQCDGVRCDMAMLMLNHVFDQTWGYFLDEDAPTTEFWADVIAPVKASHPDFLFIAEVYWGLESTLLSLGFDYTYDKVLYDRIVARDALKTRAHLVADLRYQQRTVRFIENHDEPRAAAHLNGSQRAAAVLVCTAPGMTLLHDGQFVGRTIKLPVQLGRQPDEHLDYDLSAFYHRLLEETRAPVYQSDGWTLFEVRAAAPDDPGSHHLIAYGWRDGDERRFVVVNLTDKWSRAVVDVSAWGDLAGHGWTALDVLSGTHHFYGGDSLLRHGLVVEIAAHTAYLLKWERTRLNGG